MQSPALTQREYDDKVKAITLCGRNMGPHDYIPMSWIKSASSEHVSMLLCRVCFVRVNTETLMKIAVEAKI
jgi:hypothetical protein